MRKKFTDQDLTGPDAQDKIIDTIRALSGLVSLLSIMHINPQAAYSDRDRPYISLVLTNKQVTFINSVVMPDPGDDSDSEEEGEEEEEGSDLDEEQEA